MNYSTTVFLINPNVRAIVCTYEADHSAKKTTFKSLDQSIKKDDLVVVPTDTRHRFTVCKVTEVDADVDFDGSETMLWIVSKVDLADHNMTLVEEAEAVSAIKSAEIRKKREDLAASLMADKAASHIASLPMATRAAE